LCGRLGAHEQNESEGGVRLTPVLRRFSVPYVINAGTIRGLVLQKRREQDKIETSETREKRIKI
jgi:hypothetical protein